MKVYDSYRVYDRAREDASQLNRDNSNESYFVVAAGNHWIVASFQDGEQLRGGLSVIATPRDMGFPGKRLKAV